MSTRRAPLIISLPEELLASIDALVINRPPCPQWPFAEKVVNRHLTIQETAELTRYRLEHEAWENWRTLNNRSRSTVITELLKKGMEHAPELFKKPAPVPQVVVTGAKGLYRPKIMVVPSSSETVAAPKKRLRKKQ
jgi:hypothetical protein